MSSLLKRLVPEEIGAGSEGLYGKSTPFFLANLAFDLISH